MTRVRSANVRPVPEKHGVSRRGLMKVGAGAALALPAVNRLSSPATAQESGWQGEITMLAQAYTPNSKQPDAIQLKEFQTVADEYQAAHPGVTITFIDEDLPEYLQTVRVKAAGGELWDVFWGQSGDLNGTLPKGIARDLTADFAKPNPYIADAATWEEAMNPTVVANTQAPSGAHYNVNGDYVGTAFFYNVDLFAQAGVTEIPSTWQGILDASQKLTDAGIVVAEGFPDLSWFARHFLSDFYSGEYDALSGCDGSPGLSPQDQAAGIKGGTLSTTDPRYVGWWPVYKKFTDFWSQEFLTQDLATIDQQIHRNFAAGSIAMVYTGSWFPNAIKTIGYEFELGSFSFPILTTADTEYAKGIDTAGAVGGPNAAFQYAMTTKDSNKSMEDPAKEAAVLDWLHYIGTPAIIERVVNELGSFAPTWPGTKPVAGLETFVEQANVGLRAIDTSSVSAKLGPNLQRIFGLYLSGNSDEESSASQVQTELDMAVQDFERTNTDVDLSTCAS